MLRSQEASSKGNPKKMEQNHSGISINTQMSAPIFSQETTISALHKLHHFHKGEVFAN